jgi:hypothetical protein
MGQGRVDEAIGRIERALARLEAAADRPASRDEDAPAGESDGLAVKHRLLRRKVEGAIGQIDRLLARSEGG